MRLTALRDALQLLPSQQHSKPSQPLQSSLTIALRKHSVTAAAGSLSSRQRHAASRPGVAWASSIGNDELALLRTVHNAGNSLPGGARRSGVVHDPTTPTDPIRSFAAQHDSGCHRHQQRLGSGMTGTGETQQKRAGQRASWQQAGMPGRQTLRQAHRVQLNGNSHGNGMLRSSSSSSSGSSSNSSSNSSRYSSVSELDLKSQAIQLAISASCQDQHVPRACGPQAELAPQNSWQQQSERPDSLGAQVRHAQSGHQQQQGNSWQRPVWGMQKRRASLLHAIQMPAIAAAQRFQRADRRRHLLRQQALLRMAEQQVSVSLVYRQQHPVLALFIVRNSY